MRFATEIKRCWWIGFRILARYRSTSSSTTLSGHSLTLVTAHVQASVALLSLRFAAGPQSPDPCPRGGGTATAATPMTRLSLLAANTPLTTPIPGTGQLPANGKKAISRSFLNCLKHPSHGSPLPLRYRIRKPSRHGGDSRRPAAHHRSFRARRHQKRNQWRRFDAARPCAGCKNRPDTWPDHYTPPGLSTAMLQTKFPRNKQSRIAPGGQSGQSLR
jgi:hypothetical protein